MTRSEYIKNIIPQASNIKVVSNWEDGRHTICTTWKPAKKKIEQHIFHEVECISSETTKQGTYMYYWKDGKVFRSLHCGVVSSVTIKALYN